MLISAVTTPSTFWYVTRGTGTVALVLLTASVALGIANVRRTTIAGAPRFVLNAVHRNVSLLAVTFLVLHIVTTLLDGFAPISLLNVFLPFTSSYRTIWLGLGVVAFDLTIAITVTSLLRLRLGYETWRVTHWLAYASWPLALIHGFGTGSDTKTHWMLVLTGACVVVVVIAIMFRAGAGWPAHLVARVSAIGAAALFPIGLLAWLPGGPLGHGWAQRAGTPAYLLARASAASAASGASAASVPATPGASSGSSSNSSASFSAPISGRVRQAALPGGMMLVDISLAIKSTRLANLHIRLRGQPAPGGGVQMSSSRVTLGPADNPDEYGGRVTALQGTNIEATLAGPVGSGYTVLAQLQIAPGSSTATGTITATAQAGSR